MTDPWLSDNWLNDLPTERKPRTQKPRPPKTDPKLIFRFQEAHAKYTQAKFPQAFAACYNAPKMPKIHTANGLTQAIVKFLLWSGHRATRISSAGRMIAGKYIPGATRKGAADISATIRGRSVQIEVKVGNDRPSEYQLREQELERKAGGVYIFIKTFEEFILWYDQYLVSL